MKHQQRILTLAVAMATALCSNPATGGELKTHGIFSSHMVLQRDKPITIWGWADADSNVSVQLGTESAKTTAKGENGRWEVRFDARAASATGQTLTVTSGGETITMDDILIGDLWVMNGQSNMAFGLGKTSEADMESAQAHLPLFRRFGISANEQAEPQSDLRPEAIQGDGWTVSSPETAGGFSAIGFSFGSRLQRALQIPIGIIDNARGGASIESLVPPHKFKDHPMAAAYKAHLDELIAEFDAEALVEQKWQNQLARAKSKGVPEDKWPAKPGVESLRSWDRPDQSPSHNGSCYNGMFGVFKGLNIKGVLFHQGYNNAMGTNCRPKRYRALVKLMVDGWREDFNDPALPVGIIGFCAGSIPQTRDNFEIWSNSPASYIREAQRLGLADLEDPVNTAFLPAYDIQVPGLHPSKKMAHAVRSARWALDRVYGMKVNWDSATLLTAEPQGDHMVLTFDKPVLPDDMSTVVEGFSIAGEDGKFYLAHATWPLKKDVGIWNTANKSFESNTIHVWSPLVDKPGAVRYAWATSPMGNLKVNGKEWLPLQSFRTDDWDWPEAGPDTDAVDRSAAKARAEECAERLEYRETEEAKRAVEILGRLKTLGRKQ